MEEQIKSKFAETKFRLDQEEVKREELENRKLLYVEKGKELRQSNLSVIELRNNHDAILRMDEWIREQDIVVNQVAYELEEVRLELIEMQKERKTYEKLRETAFEEFVAEENRLEAKEIDELVSYKHH